MIVKSYVKTYVPQSWSHISPDLSMNIYDIPMISPCLASFFACWTRPSDPTPGRVWTTTTKNRRGRWRWACCAAPWNAPCGQGRWPSAHLGNGATATVMALGNSEKLLMGPLGYAGVNMVNTRLTHMIFRFCVVCITVCLCGVCVCVCGCIKNTLDLPWIFELIIRDSKWDELPLIDDGSGGGWLRRLQGPQRK